MDQSKVKCWNPFCKHTRAEHHSTLEHCLHKDCPCAAFFDPWIHPPKKDIDRDKDSNN